MKTLTQIYFKPPGEGALYFAQGVFAGMVAVEFGELPVELQASVEGAMGWLSGMAGMRGFVGVEVVWLRRGPDVEAGSEEEPVMSASFVAEISGVNAEGLPGFAVINSVPGPETTAMAGLWDLFQGQINGGGE